MSNAKHTPGPWYQRNAYSNSEYFHVGSDARERVAVCHTEKDASLIAAAPEQNKALIDLLELVEELDCLAASNDPRAIAARAAIAKAKGE